MIKITNVANIRKFLPETNKKRPFSSIKLTNDCP